MKACCVLIMAVAMTTAAAPAREESDEFEDWFIPFYSCNPSGAEEIKSHNSLLYNRLLEARMIVWPKIDKQSAKLVVETANKIKPVLIKCIKSVCSVISSSDDRIEQAMRGYIRDSEMLEVLRMNVMKNFTVGDLYSTDTMVKKLTQEIRVTLNYTKTKLTENEKTVLMDIFSRFLAAAKEAYDDVEAILKSLTLEEVWKLKLTFDQIAKDLLEF